MACFCKLKRPKNTIIGVEGGGGGREEINVKTSKIYSLTLIIDQTHPSSLCSDNIHEEGKSMGEEWMEGNMVIF